MDGSRRYRVVRCGRCERIYPYAQTRCPGCASRQRVGSLVSREEIEHAAYVNMAPIRELAMPRHLPVNPPERVPLWRRAIVSPAEWALQVTGMRQRR